MKAYVVVNTEIGHSTTVGSAIASLPHVIMADPCWGGGDVYAVVEFEDWKELDSVVLEKIHHMDGVIRTETHIAIAA